MTRNFLEELLKNKIETKDIKSIIDSILDEHSKYIGELKKQININKAKILFLEQTNNELKEELSLKDDKVENLKNSTEDVEGLKTQIETLQAENQANTEKHTQEMNALKKSVAIEKGLSNAKARNIKAVLGLLDLDKIKLEEDGSLKGLSEQIDGLLQDDNSKFLFETETKLILKGAIPDED